MAKEWDAPEGKRGTKDVFPYLGQGLRVGSGLAFRQTLHCQGSISGRKGMSGEGTLKVGSPEL